jgi:hypothetical protein
MLRNSKAIIIRMRRGRKINRFDRNLRNTISDSHKDIEMVGTKKDLRKLVSSPKPKSNTIYRVVPDMK